MVAAETPNPECIACGASLEYSVTAVVRGYCDVCLPDECPDCGCGHVYQRRSPNATEPRAKWRCDNGCFFEVTAP